MNEQNINDLFGKFKSQHKRIQSDNNLMQYNSLKNRFIKMMQLNNTGNQVQNVAHKSWCKIQHRKNVFSDNLDYYISCKKEQDLDTT